MKLSAAAFMLLASQGSAEVYFKETFSDDSWSDRWVQSNWKGSDMGSIERSAGQWQSDVERDSGLLLADDFRFYTFGSKLDKPFSNRDQDLVVQFSVKHEQREYAFCGGGYIKLLPADTELESWGGDAPYFVMFGPDLCGYDVSRVHLIFNHKGENLLKTKDIPLEYKEKNEFTHLYTLVLKPDNTYKVLFDMEEKASGSLWDDWAFPPKMIDDAEDKKPEDWVDEKEIPDPDDTKPDGWDDIPAQIPDPDAVMPDDWDVEDDGEWESPTIDNPEYKGEWKPKMIPNPEYKGEWKPTQLENPDYDENIAQYDNIGAVGFELWVVNKGSIFDNVFVGNSLEEATKFAEETFVPTRDGEKAVKEAFDEAKKSAEAAAKEESEGHDEL